MSIDTLVEFGEESRRRLEGFAEVFRLPVMVLDGCCFVGQAGGVVRSTILATFAESPLLSPSSTDGREILCLALLTDRTKRR